MKTSSRENEIKGCSPTPNTLDSDSTSVNIHELPTSCTQQENEYRSKGSTSQAQGQKSLKTSSFYSHAQPCPFTFLTAVKCKFPLNKSHASSNRIGSPEKVEKVSEYSMDSVEPLKIPNLQISPRVCRVPEKIQSSSEKLLTSKSSDSNHKTKSSNTLVSTCAEHSSSTIATKLESKNYRQIKVPDTVSSRGKGLLKNNARDYSRNKENRFKKIKKEGSLKSRNDASTVKLGSRSQKHISSQDLLSRATNKAIKNDSTSSSGFRDNGNVIKKIRDKPPKYSQFSTRSNKESLIKSDTCLPQESSLDSSHQNTSSNKCNNKGGSPVPNTPNSNEKPALLEQEHNSTSAVPADTVSQDHLEHSSDHKSTRGSQVPAMANVEKYQVQSLATPSLTLSTTREDAFKSLHTQQNNAQRDSSTILSALSDSNQFSNSSMIETKLDQDSLSDKLMDPVRISFREDSYSNQPEFTNLVTPNVNLTIRSKRRKHVIQLIDSDDDCKDSKHSRKDQDVAQGAEVRARTESNSSGQLVYVHKAQVLERSAQQGSSNNTWGTVPDIITESKSANTDNEEEMKTWSAKGMMDKPSHLTDTIQTETTSYQYGGDSSLIFSRAHSDPRETFPHISLKSGGEDASRIDDISLSKKMRTMSEISLHETTSSIRTESGTEISISLRDFTCSFNKNLDLEMAQLIDDERQRYNKIEMLFKSREKSLNDRTRKLVKLEEQKKALRDTGQDSRISSVKKKQRALLLKLQQEKDEMNRLKELHKIASQERKLMLQKQRDMFNPDMSTKNILHKLKRSADSQSPRRLSGPMKGYDIRSNSSMSSLIDSDKSQLDRSKFDSPINKSDTAPLRKESKANVKLGIDRFPIKVSRSAESRDTSFSRAEAGKFDEKMPKSDLKYQLYDFESVLEKGALELLKDDNRISLSRSKDQNFIFENVRSKSNALIEEFTEIWKSHFSQSKNQQTSAVENSSQELDESSVKLQSDANIDDNKSTKRKGLKLHKSKTLPINSSDTCDVRSISKTLRQKSASSEALDKRYVAKDDAELDEFLSNAKQISVQELVKHSDLLRQRNEQLLKDIVDDRNDLAKQGPAILLPSSSSKKQKRKKEDAGEEERDEEDEVIEKSDNVSVQSHVSLAISHQSSNESDKSYLKSVVIRSQQDYQPNSSFQTSKKLEQILKAREATLISRRNCVEEWIAWHARLRDEEERVSRMEKAAYKLVSATARTLSLNDATISSDNSDVEGRIEVLTKKLSDRRFEMTRLKKEARKQAKRRLRALEANLLTQIKRYDATINEMRKKLETKKGPNKESTKLELESKSVNDYKVPDVPIKNIQEIYKRSDLLRSQSDQSDVPKNKNYVRDEMNDIESSSSRTENDRAANIRTTKSINVSGEGSKSTSLTSNSCKSRSQSEVQRSGIPDSYNKDSTSIPSSNISGISSSKVGSVEKHASGISNAADKLTHELEDASSSVLSNKLSNIQLHNKELNDDIHNLENDLRELSEMMLNFSKKSTDQNPMSRDSSRQTLKAIDELSPKHPLLNRFDEPKLDKESDTIDTDLQIRVKETLSNGIPDTDNISTSIEELYSEIKSNDRVGQQSHVPESSEKSIETEELYRMSKSLRTIEEKDNKNDTCSILEIISTTVEKDSSQVLSDDSDNDLKIQADDNGGMLAQSTDVSPQNQSELVDSDRGVSLRQTNSTDNILQIDSRPKLEEAQLSHEPQNVPYSIENVNEVLPAVSENAVDSDNVMTELDSFHGEELDNDKRKSDERLHVQIAENHERTSISDVEDSTVFVPKGESTNLLETFVLKLDNSSDIGMGICSEEFNDILEIIERETKNDDHILPETDHSAATKKDDTSNVVEDDHNTFNEENLDKDTTSQVSKVSTVESEKNLDLENNDVHSNEASEPAEVYKDGDDSSDGEQTNNLIEVVENKLDTLQEPAPKENKSTDKQKTHVTVFLDKTLQVIRDPEYEDISEESLEVSDIFNNTNPAFHKSSKKFTTVPEKYIIKSESNEVLRILDEISNKSNKLDPEQQQEVPSDDRIHSPADTNKSTKISNTESKQTDPPEENNKVILDNLEDQVTLNKSSIEDVKQDQDTNSETFTNLDDNKKSHVNLDTRRDSGSDIDAFSENSVNSNSLLLDERPKVNTAEFRTTPMGVSSEKDIETMIKKLKASLEQPGIEVAELEAKLLEIENLQIELAIKKLEAEEVSYYVREIPNKPPPPYTPPGSVRQSGSNGVFSSVSIIPTNIEELTFVTEKATAIIHLKKKSGEDVQLLEAPDEIYESVKDTSNNDAVKKNRLIYNTFLFDLCKELIVDIYKVEEENPGPSWTKPQVKTKRVIKIPKSVDELNEYVSKEVATLFGFKTKLQRENMVMRWSRKRRDRVDELLAKEAQAEEKEWTKFHHDELAVKNELTVTILNNLLVETTSCIKNAYAKKRKLSVL